MTTINKILLDLDGVCNRLIMHALEVCGCGVSRYDDFDYPLPGNYDIVAAANELLAPVRRVSHAEFWGNVTRDVWASTPPSDEFYWLLDLCCQLVGWRNVCFLTSPIDGPTSPESAAGKVEWIARYAPPCMRRQFLIGAPKPFCACPHSLLIDDSDDNVATFRQHGGQAWLCPRPWNSGHGEFTSLRLDGLFERHFAVRRIAHHLQALGLVPRSA